MKILRIDISSLTPTQFTETFFAEERPVIVTGVTADWPARFWSPMEISSRLEKEKITRNKTWYQATPQFASDGFVVPDLVNHILASGNTLLRTEHLRIWLSRQGHVTPFHADVNGLFVFNVQVQGRKRWQLLPPNANVRCYAFTQLLEVAYNEAVPSELQSELIEFDLEPGEMIFVPPYWYHRVVSLGDFNLNLNWVATKKESKANRLSVREVEMMKILLPASRLKPVRRLSDLLLGSKERDYIRNYAGRGGTEMMRERANLVGYPTGFRRLLRELTRLPRLVFDFQKLNAYNQDPLNGRSVQGGQNG